MRIILQRVAKASVTIDGKITASIDRGLLVFVGIEHTDTREDVLWLVRKIVQMRIFNDADNKMNLSITEIGGDMLIVSQFTLHASTKKGNRPSFIRAAPPHIAKLWYELFLQSVEGEMEGHVQSGEFGADMQVSLINDGPVTIFMDSNNRS